MKLHLSQRVLFACSALYSLYLYLTPPRAMGAYQEAVDTGRLAARWVIVALLTAIVFLLIDWIKDTDAQ